MGQVCEDVFGDEDSAVDAGNGLIKNDNTLIIHDEDAPVADKESV